MSDPEAEAVLTASSLEPSLSGATTTAAANGNRTPIGSCTGHEMRLSLPRVTVLPPDVLMSACPAQSRLVCGLSNNAHRMSHRVGRKVIPILAWSDRGSSEYSEVLPSFESVTSRHVASYIHTLHYIPFHGSKVSQMTVGCGISHTITKTHVQYN
jgi:hypothetical protein